MKKDQNLPNKNKYSTHSSGKPFPSNSNYSRNQPPYNSSYRGRSPERRISRNFSQNRYSRSNSQNNQNNYSRSNSNTTEFVFAYSSHSNPRNRHYSNNRSRNSSYNRVETLHTVELEVILTIEIRTIQTTDQGTIHFIDLIITEQMITIETDHKIIHKIETQVTIIDTEIIPSHHIGIINRYPDSKHRYRRNTPKHQRHINQVQTNEETTSDPPVIDDKGSNELQLNHINCESTDTESDKDNTISVNMITVGNNYEPIIHEQPFTSHI